MRLVRILTFAGGAVGLVLSSGSIAVSAAALPGPLSSWLLLALLPVPALIVFGAALTRRRRRSSV
jgi:hypothetical protein